MPDPLGGSRSAGRSAICCHLRGVVVISPANGAMLCNRTRLSSSGLTEDPPNRSWHRQHSSQTDCLSFNCFILIRIAPRYERGDRARFAGKRHFSSFPLRALLVSHSLRRSLGGKLIYLWCLLRKGELIHPRCWPSQPWCETTSSKHGVPLVRICLIQIRCCGWVNASDYYWARRLRCHSRAFHPVTTDPVIVVCRRDRLLFGESRFIGDSGLALWQYLW